MQEISFEEALELILTQDSRYQRDAYCFVRDALEFTRKRVGKETSGRDRHVTPRQLLEGIRQFALAEFGPMALTVFEEWGVRRGRDFGEIVFNLVEIGQFAKTPTDRREDFDGGYDFEEAFRKPFMPAGKPLQKPEPKSSSA